MNTEGLLEVVQVQRHDFLNHLQVISGLLQLNKSDRVLDYIRQVCQEYERLSKIIHLKMPEVTAVLLVNHNEADKHQVQVDYSIQSNLEHCPVPGSVVGNVLKQVLSKALACLAPPAVYTRRLEIIIQNSERRYTIRCKFPEPMEEAVEDAQAALSLAGKELEPWGGRVNLAVNRGGGEIFMVLPRSEA